MELITIPKGIALYDVMAERKGTTLIRVLL